MKHVVFNQGAVNSIFMVFGRINQGLNSNLLIWHLFSGLMLIRFNNFRFVLDVQIVRQEVKEVITDEDLDKIVDIVLEETDTIWLFEQMGVSVSTEAEDHSTIE